MNIPNLPSGIPIIPAQFALQHVGQLISNRPWFENYEKHIEAHRSLDILLTFIKQKIDEEQKKVQTEVAVS